MTITLIQEDRAETLTGVAGERDSVAERYNRIKAKYGDQSPQAAVGAAWLELLDRESAELEAQRIREFTPAPQTAGDRFVVYGRILNGKGVGLPRVTVVARSPKRSELAVTKTANDGRFELIVKVNRGNFYHRDCIKGSRKPAVLARAFEPMRDGIFELRVIRSHCDPHGISRDNYAPGSTR